MRPVPSILLTILAVTALPGLAPAAPGELDSSFNGTGMARHGFGPGHDYCNATTFQSDGKVVVAGSSVIGSYYNYFVARYNTDGSPDASFGTGGKALIKVGFGGLCKEVRMQSDGKIVVAGSAGSAGGNLDFAVARLNADGSPDETFGIHGAVTTYVGSGDDEATAVRIQTDGMIVVGGYTYLNSNYDMAVVRFTASGALDVSFDGDGRKIISFGTAHDRAYGLVLQTDSKIILAGTTIVSNQTRYALVRCNTNGSLDTSFDGDGLLTTTIAGECSGVVYQTATITAPAKIAVTGSRWTGVSEIITARFNLDGTPDATFDGDGKVTTSFPQGAQATSITGQNPRLVVAGWVADASNLPRVLVMRYTSNGSLDPTFDGDGINTAAVGSQIAYETCVFGISQVLVACSAYFGQDSDLAVVRFNSNGTIDTSFDGDGIRTDNLGVATAIGKGLAVQPDDRIVACGGAIYDGFFAARYTSDGALDPSFAGDGATTISFGTPGNDPASGNAVALQSDGKVVIAGTRGYNQNGTVAVARLNPDGTLDTSFSQDGKVNFVAEMGWNTISAVVIQPDGKILVAGDCDVYDDFYEINIATFLIVRLNPDGSFDNSFSGDGVAAPSTTGFTLGRAMALQADGRIVAAGLSQTGAGRDRITLARYTATGELDTSFNGSGVAVLTSVMDAAANAVVVQTNGKIVVAGEVLTGAGYDYIFARYNVDGTLDTSFDGDGITTVSFPLLGDDRANDLTLLADGRLLATGQAMQNAKNVYSAVCFHPDGSLDASFGSAGKVMVDFGSHSDIARGIALDSQERIVLLGDSGGLFGVARLQGDVVSGVDTPDLSLEPFGITQVGPNPFRRDTRVDFALPRPAGVTLRVFGPGGRLVATLTDAQLSAGSHSTTWTGNDDHGRPAPSGVYYLRLDVDGEASTRQIVRMR